MRLEYGWHFFIMKDLKGLRFRRLSVIERNGINNFGNIIWKCKCDCGKTHNVASSKLIQGKVGSCGCYAKEIRINQLQKHGLTTGGKPRTFIIWNGMKSRCFNPKNISFKSYGGRGITICNEWLLFENFHNWAINNGYLKTLTIDRIDNDGNYEPKNCVWINSIDNKKKQRSARYITIFHQTKNINDWCKFLNISKSTAYKYLNNNELSFIKLCEEKLTGKGQVYFAKKIKG